MARQMAPNSSPLPGGREQVLLVGAGAYAVAMRKLGPKTYLWSFLAAIPLVLAVSLWVTENRATLPKCLQPLIDGWGGNITAGIVGSLLFLLVTLYLDARTGEQIDRIIRATDASETILQQRERQIRNEQLIVRFEGFLWKENHHNARFPDLKPTPDSLGLEYELEPVRDEKGEPRKYVTEMDTLWVVKVVEPAYWEVMSQEQRAEYVDSPIREQEFYFCQFFNDSWHMAKDSDMGDAHPFYLSGKVGPATWGESANQFVARFHDDPFAKLARLARLFVDPKDGTPRTSGGVDVYEVYRDEGGSLFVRVGDSGPKKLYFTNATRTHDTNEWGELVIEGIRGRAAGTKVENIKTAIVEHLRELHVEIPRVPWWETEPYRGDQS